MEFQMIKIAFVIVSVLLSIPGCAHESEAPLRLTGIWHKVRASDTISSVAGRHGATPEALIELNDLPSNGSLSGREEVFVLKNSGKAPGTGAPPAEAASAVGAIPSGTSSRGQRGVAAQVQCGRDGKPCFEWPVKGKVVSTFGPRSKSHHDGVDISAKRGTKVRSAADGKVLYSGSEIKGYGNLIIVRHEGGIITVYAHNDKNLVKEGTMVKRGQTVAKVGNSGSASRVYLHFEVRIGEKPRNPLLYLPDRK